MPPSFQYTKPWKSYEDQLNQLTERGMCITDRALALDYLERIGYYRLSGYWHAFRKRSGQLCLLDKHGRKPKKPRVESIALEPFRPGTTFQNAVDLYVFDKRLRMHVLDALERIEVALRVDISHTLGEIDRFSYLKPELLHESFSVDLDPKTGVSRHHAWLSKHAQLIGRSKEEFVHHIREKYGLPLPIWVACEVWDFGTMSTLYSGMRETDQDAISGKYGVKNGRTFASWLRSLNYLRNVCAHHSRLWNRNIVDQPKLPPQTELEWVVPFEADNHTLARCFVLLRIARHLMHQINPKSTWPERMKAHLKGFPDLAHVGLNLARMGAPEGWESDW